MACWTKVANGNITPSRFVKLDTTADGKCLQSGAGERVFGVSQKGTRNPPYSTLDDGFAAIAGENLHIFGPGELCGLEMGGAVTRGDRLKADASGRGVTTVTNLDEVGAVAMQSAVLGEVVEVLVVFPAQVSS